MTEPTRIFAKDYQAPDYLIEETRLSFQLSDHETLVSSQLSMKRSCAEGTALFLHGESLKLLSLQVDGVAVPESDYHIDEKGVTLSTVLPESFVLSMVTQIDPANNLALEGLYKSGSIYCTQMEAEGFRRVTYYLDRPDVMSKFTTRIEGDANLCPQLLSNGNLIESGTLEGGRHFAIWEDPHPKPCYLFALVAGDLGLVEDQFKTRSGREVICQVYVDKGNEGRAHHAMVSLKKAMTWDEERFGLEYDLDLYMIVAVDAFNMGAMENKGLNIFNSTAVLADTETATDMDFHRIESIVAHEYFHNWTGNRVTCRDWFQLTLKEGLTVFRDQEFSMDAHNRSVLRIMDVAALRERQYLEDSGPNAHSIKPNSYYTINNFYTATVYEKGAEVIRMIYTLVGREGFRKGMDLYFERHDGQAVCTEQFVAAMADASGVDLNAFEASWYHQAGTPRLLAKGEYDAEKKTYSLMLEQVLPDQAGEQALAYHIPVKMALLDDEGNEIPLCLNGDDLGTETVLDLKTHGQTFTFTGVETEPCPSLLRDFSAPVVLEMDRSVSDMLKAWSLETDDFNRYELGQKIMFTEIQHGLEAKAFDGRFLQAMRQMLEQPMEHAIKAEMLSLPSLNRLLEEQKVYDPSAVEKVRTRLKRELADFCREELLSIYHRLCKPDDKGMTSIDMGRRKLKNACLDLLCSLDEREVWDLAGQQYHQAANMTDRMAAFQLLVDAPMEDRESALRDFEERFHDDTVVMNKFFSAQSASHRDDVLSDIEALEGHRCYDAKNPNKVRALIGGFCRNLVAFHAKDGSGYCFVVQHIMAMDEYNPSMASALARFFAKYPTLKPDLADLMKKELSKILLKPGLSGDTYEIVSKTLGAR